MHVFNISLKNGESVNVGSRLAGNSQRLFTGAAIRAASALLDTGNFIHGG